MKELQELINAKTKAMSEDGTITALVEKGVERAIESAINDQFRSFGTITKQIEEGFKAGLKIDIDEIDFESYNEQMLVAVKARVGELFKGAASERFMTEMDKILEPAPKEITAQDFVEKVVSFWKTDEPWDADGLDDDATVEWKVSDRASSMKSGSLNMWKQKEQKSYGSLSSRSAPADLQLYIIDGEIRISHKQHYNPTCFREHEAYVFKLYAAGTKITGLADFDPDVCDLTLKDEDY